MRYSSAKAIAHMASSGRNHDHECDWEAPNAAPPPPGGDGGMLSRSDLGIDSGIPAGCDHHLYSVVLVVDLIDARRTMVALKIYALVIESMTAQQYARWIADHRQLSPSVVR